MRISGIGIRAVGGSTPRLGSDPGPVAYAADSTLALTEAAARDALARARLTAADLGEPHLLVCDAWFDGEPSALVARRVLDHLGVGRAHTHCLGPGADDALPLLRLLSLALREDRTTYRGLLLAPAPPQPPVRGRDRLRIGGTAAAIVVEHGWPHNRLRSVVTRDVGPLADPGPWIPSPRRPGVGPVSGRRMATALLERPAWLAAHPGHTRDLGDRPLTLVCSLVGKALREARTPWETIDHVVLHTAAHDMNDRFRRHFRLKRRQITDVGAESGLLDSAGLLIGLKDVLESDPEPGTRVLLASLGIDGNWSAAVVEV